MRAGFCLLGLLASYAGFMSIPGALGCLSTYPRCEGTLDPIVRALSLLQISNVTTQNLGNFHRIIDVFFRVIIVVQVALLTLAIRNRVRR